MTSARYQDMKSIYINHFYIYVLAMNKNEIKITNPLAIASQRIK